MDITDVRVNPVDPRFHNENHYPLLATCSITFDDTFVVHELKVIGTDPIYVAMPSRRTHGRCSCGFNNQTHVRYCGGCGRRVILPLPINRHGEKVHHCDIAHPLTREFRDVVADRVTSAVRAVISGSIVE